MNIRRLPLLSLHAICYCTLLFNCTTERKDLSVINLDTAIIEGKNGYYHEKRERIRDEQEDLDREAYHRDAVHHPLRHFDLSYPEWENIKCIIAVNEADYRDKFMIGLIEKSGTLRIRFEDQTLHLAPVAVHEMKPGDWSGTFKNDSIEIKLYAMFEDIHNKGRMRGNGRILAKVNYYTFEEKAFFVYGEE
jgi:hypothetical protein